jgi:aerobic carbon-monoxide dehydrogenase medium subunit
MYVKPFRYVAVRSVEEASALLREHGSDTKVLAGGQSLIPMLNLGLVQVDVLVDIGTIPGLDSITGGDGAIQIGALARHRVLERSDVVRDAQPLLRAAVAHVGSPRVRNRGTTGGSLAHNDPSAELPLVMGVIEAEYEVSNGRESRRIPAVEFPVTYYTTRLREDELLVRVEAPALAQGWGWGFHEVSRRAGDFAMVAAAAVARCRDGVIESVRLGLSGVGERAVRCGAFERAAVATPPDRIADIAEAITEEINPSDDALASGAYRARLARVLGVRAVRDACRSSLGDTS